MKRIFIVFILIYQFFSKQLGLLPNRCVFTPTCSQYTKEAIIKFGVLKGLFLGIRRVIRCHPWQTNHYDPVISKP